MIVLVLLVLIILIIAILIFGGREQRIEEKKQLIQKNSHNYCDCFQ